jgi:hypothetical protein
VNAEQAIALTDPEQERVLEAANVVTLARTGVDYDYRGDVVDAHAPEMPTRFAKQLTQLVRGAVALGIDRTAAVRLAIRCARDSMPPLRLAILDDIAAHPGAQTRDVRRRLGKPRATVDRQLQALHMLGVLTCDEEEAEHRGAAVTRWRYWLVPGINPSVLDSHSVPEKSPHTGTGVREERQGERAVEIASIPPDISGTDDLAPPADATETSGGPFPLSGAAEPFADDEAARRELAEERFAIMEEGRSAHRESATEYGQPVLERLALMSTGGSYEESE